MTTTLDPGGSAPFNLTLLGEALARRMEAVFDGFRLPQDNPDAVLPEPDPDDPDPAEPDLSILFDTVTVYFGSIRARSRVAGGAAVEPSWPLVLVRPRASSDTNGEHGAQETIVTVDFYVGARRLDKEGFDDIVALVERIRTSLLRDPVIESRGRCELPLDIEIGEDETFPQWFGLVTARFNIPQLIEENTCD